MKMKKKSLSGKEKCLYSIAAVATELVPIDNDPANDGLIDVIVDYMRKMHHTKKKYLRHHQYMLTGCLATNTLVDAYGNAPNIVSYADKAIQDKFCEACTIANIEKKLGYKPTLFQKEFWTAIRQIAVDVANSVEAK